MVREEIQLKLILSARLRLRPRVNISGCLWFRLKVLTHALTHPRTKHLGLFFGWEAFLSTADSRNQTLSQLVCTILTQYNFWDSVACWSFAALVLMFRKEQFHLVHKTKNPPERKVLLIEFYPDVGADVETKKTAKMPLKKTCNNNPTVLLQNFNLGFNSSGDLCLKGHHQATF